MNVAVSNPYKTLVYDSAEEVLLFQKYMIMRAWSGVVFTEHPIKRNITLWHYVTSRLTCVVCNKAHQPQQADSDPSR